MTSGNNMHNSRLGTRVADAGSDHRFDVQLKELKTEFIRLATDYVNFGPLVTNQLQSLALRLDLLEATLQSKGGSHMKKVVKKKPAKKKAKK